MHQWLVTLRVRVLPESDDVKVVIKVEMSDEAYGQHEAFERKTLVETLAMETVGSAAGNPKIWKSRTAPWEIEIVDTYVIRDPQKETGPADHWTFSSLFAWVKAPKEPI
jgi:hypothetical protein